MLSSIARNSFGSLTPIRHSPALLHVRSYCLRRSPELRMVFALGDVWGEVSAMMNRAKRLLQDESGQDLIEYALIGALVALVAISGLTGLSAKINSEFTKIGGDL
jgi:pilus assembly protein Flp/PilA